MLKEHVNVLRRLMILADLVMLAACFAAGFHVCALLVGMRPPVYYRSFFVLYMSLWGLLLYALGMYESFRTKQFPDLIITIVQAALIGTGVTGVLLYFLGVKYIDRAFILVVFGLAAAALCVEKTVIMLFFHFVRRKGCNIRNLLIVGTGLRAMNFIRLVGSHSEWGLRVVGLIDKEPAKTGTSINGYKILGSFADVVGIINNNVVDEVVFIVPRSWLESIEKLMCSIEDRGTRISVAVDYFQLKFSKAKQTDLEGFPLLTFEAAPNNIWHLMLKRSIDVVISAAGLILLSPVFAVAAVTVKLASPGPVFFRQERVGLNGRKFVLYKFRTMVTDAEERLKDLIDLNEMKGPVFKMGIDPRVTQVGHFLRKTSIDELPQLWNVLKGQMSIVGPRPALHSEVSRYDNWQRRRLSMRPGITCIWQTNGRNKIRDFEEWVKLDLEYIDKWSIWLDTKLMLKTIPAVLMGVGAK